MRKDSKKISDLLERGIEYEIRQFACAPCTRTWWKKVPDRKQVSKCFRCNVKYDPVPQDKEWGWAKFVCTCSNEFHAFGEMGVTQSRCYDCNIMVHVTKVLPPRRRIGSRKKSKKPHSCNADNCYNQDDLNAPFAAMNMHSQNSTHLSSGNTYNLIAGAGASQKASKGKKKGNGGHQENDQDAKQAMCLHPLSNQGGRKILTPSKRHVSTGSTVATFLSQGSLDTMSVSSFALMSTIREDEN